MSEEKITSILNSVYGSCATEQDRKCATQAFEAGARWMRERAAVVVEKHYAKSLEAEKTTTDPALRGAFSDRCDILGNVVRHEIRALPITPPSGRNE